MSSAGGWPMPQLFGLVCADPLSRHMRKFLLFLLFAVSGLFAALTWGPAVGAQSDDTRLPLSVVTKEIEPFVFVNSGEVSGFSIDLWEAIASELDVTFEYTIVNTVVEQIEAVSSEEADAAIAAISITEEREALVDFSHRYYESGLGILTKASSGATFRESVSAALSPSLLRLFAFLVVTILIAGHVIWLMERGRNKEFPNAYLPGVWEGIWWAAVTVTTVGYGDKTPGGRLGRLFGIFWMFAGLFIIANFTAGVTSQLTLQSIQGAINGPEDLRGKQVVTVSGSTADEWLIEQGIRHTAVSTLPEAYALLEAGNTQAVVFDHPVLLFHALQNPDGGYVVPGGPFNREDYGIAFPSGSPLREEVNIALLKLLENGTYDQIRNKWYGGGAGS